MEELKTLLETLLDSFSNYLLRLAAAVFVLFLFWLATRFTTRFITHLSRECDTDKRGFFVFVSRMSRIALLIIGSLFALAVLGVNIGATITGLGLTGFALGFALKDALANLLSGLLIYFYQPFRRGQRILVSGYEGIVTDINLRYTTLNADGKTVLIPNSQLLTNPITLLPPPELESSKDTISETD